MKHLEDTLRDVSHFYDYIGKESAIYDVCGSVALYCDGDGISRAHGDVVKIPLFNGGPPLKYVISLVDIAKNYQSYNIIVTVDARDGDCFGVSLVAERPSFDKYFLDIARSVSHRSEDIFVHHGAVLVDKNKHIIGTGYNGFVADFDSFSVDITDRDGRRPYMVHAEQNAILNSVLHPDWSTMYVTGEPCINCLLSMVNFGVGRVCYIDSIGSITDDDNTREIKAKIIDQSQIEVCRFDKYGEVKG